MVLASARRASSYRCFKLVYTFSASVTARRSRASSIARGGIWRKELEPASIRRPSSASRAASSPASARATAGIVCRSSVAISRSEEHTSELQSLTKLVCRLLLEKKKEDGGRQCTS